MGIGPFDDATFVLGPEGQAPRLGAVVIGGAAAGKTSLLAAIATTRPGHAVAQLGARADGGAAGYAICDWHLSDDDPTRPHPLRVVSPNAKLDEPDDTSLVRRREQTLFDRRAAEGGYALVAISGARWFSRTAVALASPDRSILRYDVRSPASFDDASRADLARETKQALVFAKVGAALAAHGSPLIASGEGHFRPRNDGPREDLAARLRRCDAAMTAAMAAVLEDTGYAYEGVDPLRLEPVFSERGTLGLFDDLPRPLRHVVALAALPLRALWGAYPHADPREAEGVVLVDDAEAQMPPSHQRTLLPRLRNAMPRVQWIVTTASPAVAEGAEQGDVIAARRLPGSTRVELFDGASAVLH